MVRKKVTKCTKIPKNKIKLVKQTLTGNQQIVSCNPAPKAKSTPKVYKAAPKQNETKCQDLPKKHCGCPVTVADAVAMGYLLGDDRTGVTKKSYLIENSSLVSIVEPNFLCKFNSKMRKTCQACPCGSDTFLFNNKVCNCRFADMVYPRKHEPCIMPKLRNPDSSTSLQVPESIVPPLTRRKSAQTSFIMESDELISLTEVQKHNKMNKVKHTNSCESNSYTHVSIKDCDPFNVGICPYDCEEQSSEDIDYISNLDCICPRYQDNELSPSPSYDYFLFWDPKYTTPDNQCPPKPKDEPPPELDMTPWPPSNKNDCELMEEMTRKEKKIRRKHKKKLDLQTLLRNWCPAAFKEQSQPKDQRQKKHEMNIEPTKPLFDPVPQLYLSDRLFNLKVLTDRRMKAIACCNGFLLPADCPGLALTCSRVAQGLNYCS